MKTVAEMTKHLIRKGHGNVAVAREVRKKHPYSTITAATVNYVRNDLRKTDKSIKSDTAVRKGTK